MKPSLQLINTNFKPLTNLKCILTRNLSSGYTAVTKNKKFNVNYQIYLSKLFN